MVAKVENAKENDDKAGVNILQNSPIIIGEKLSLRIKYWERVCQFGVIYFVLRTDLGKSLPKPLWKSYHSLRKIFTPASDA